jgi:hypothetical protein
MAQFEDNPQDRWAKPRRTTDDQFDFEEVDNLLSRDYVQNNKIQLVRNITPSGVSSQTVKITDGVDIMLVNPDGSINVSAAPSAKSSTQFTGLASVTKTTAGGGTVYTVPAGKIAIIVSAGASGGVSAVDSNVLAVVGGVNRYVVWNKSTALESTVWSGEIKLSAGDTIYMTGSSGCWASYYEMTA